MKKITSTVINLIVICIVFSLTGCNSTASGSNVTEIKTYSNFVQALQSNGYKVEEIKPTEADKLSSFFSVYAKYIDVDKNRISVYEFSDSDSAIEQTKTISKDGFKIGNAMIDWIDKPHFYNKGKLIVGYTGSYNKKLLKDLEILLGKSVTN